MNARMRWPVKTSVTGKPFFLPPRHVLIQRKCACGKTSGPTGECEQCLQQRESRTDRSAEIPPIVHEVLNSPGRPLDADSRGFMEPRFGYDFGHVRVHTDAKAAESAGAVNALAYTVGQTIVFGQSRYAPSTHAGRELLAHELTHVVQGAGAGRMTASPGFGLLMRQPAPSEKTTPQADPDPCTAPDNQLPTYDKAEEKQRQTILQDMLRGVTADEKKAWCKRLRRAMAAFSAGQLLTMKAAGVRFWRSGEFPPPFSEDYAPSKKRRREMARYEPNYRVILLGPQSGPDEVRHELAHAWDHVRTGKVARLDTYKGERLKKAVLAPVTFSSETDEKRVTIEETVEAEKNKVRLSVKDAFDRFMKRPAQSYWSFASSKTDPEHVTSDVREFYAEGYSVFHGGDEDAQAKLLCDAPELYQLLEEEAKTAKLAIPDRGKLTENNKNNNRKCS